MSTHVETAARHRADDNHHDDGQDDARNNRISEV